MIYTIVWYILWYGIYYGMIYTIVWYMLSYDIYYRMVYTMVWYILSYGIYYGMVYTMVWYILWYGIYYGMVYTMYSILLPILTLFFFFFCLSSCSHQEWRKIRGYPSCRFSRSPWLPMHHDSINLRCELSFPSVRRNWSKATLQRRQPMQGLRLVLYQNLDWWVCTAFFFIVVLFFLLYNSMLFPIREDARRTVVWPACRRRSTRKGGENLLFRVEHRLHAGDGG